jgi:hypothetical protein
LKEVLNTTKKLPRYWDFQPIWTRSIFRNGREIANYRNRYKKSVVAKMEDAAVGGVAVVVAVMMIERVQ